MWGWCGQLSLVSKPCVVSGALWWSVNILALLCRWMHQDRNPKLQSHDSSAASLCTCEPCVQVTCCPVNSEFPPTWEFTIGVEFAQVEGNAQVSGHVLVWNLFIWVVPSCEWGKAQLFLLTCIRCSLKAWRRWSLFILFCPATSPRQALISWFSGQPWFPCWNWMSPSPPSACTWCFVSCWNTPWEYKKWGQLLLWKSPKELHPCFGTTEELSVSVEAKYECQGYLNVKCCCLKK